MEIENSYRNMVGVNNLLSAKVNNIRISPSKPRNNEITRKSLKPFSSSIIQEKKKQPLPTKEDIIKMNSKLELIKSKCMNNRPKLGRSDSRKTMNSVWMSGEQLNDSVDLDSDEANDLKGQQGKVHLLKSKFADRPPTVFFKYPKCCGI